MTVSLNAVMNRVSTASSREGVWEVGAEAVPAAGDETDQDSRCRL